jgi:hypothetical protein
MGKPMSKIGTMLQVGRTFGMRDGMLRLEYELQRGSGLMSWRMRSVQGWNSWDLKRIAPGARAEEMVASRRDGRRRFLFTDARTLGTSIRKIIGPDEEKICSRRSGADSCRQSAVLRSTVFRLRLPAAVVSQSCNRSERFTAAAVDADAFRLARLRRPEIHSRAFPVLVCLSAGSRLRSHGDERFPQAFWTAIEDWALHSPTMAGPLWICGQECSLRILAWTFALHAFVNSPSTTNERVALLVSMIAAHAWRTAQTLGYARSQRSNHLISEAVGLWTAGTLYPELREAKVWQNLGGHLLQEAVLDQITIEGVSQQHSFNYQRMILHLLLWTLRLAEIHHAPLPDDIRQRAQAAFEFMRAWVDPESGLAPNYGSDDGSLILPLALPVSRFSSLAAVGRRGSRIALR